MKTYDYPLPDYPLPDYPLPDYPLPDYPLPDYPLPEKQKSCFYHKKHTTSKFPTSGTGLVAGKCLNIERITRYF